MKKIISLVLAVLLCLGAFPLAALAEGLTENSVNYVALSDSMGQGYMFLDYNENAEQGHYCGWEGTSERSYIKKFARDLEKDFGEGNVHFTDLTIQGLQPDEVYAFLRPDTFDFDSMTRGAKKHIGWWVGDYHTDEEQSSDETGEGKYHIFDTFKDMSDYYINAIKEADVITYDIGMNYFGTFLTDEHGENENYMDLMEDKGFAILIEVARRLLLNELGNSEQAETLTKRILYSYMSYLTYSEKCIDAIYKLNPDVKLIIVPLANPNRELYITVDGTTLSYTDLIDTMMESLNDYMRSSGKYSGKYYFAELSGSVVSFADELYLYPDSISEDAKALLERTVSGNDSILGKDYYPVPETLVDVYNDIYEYFMTFAPYLADPGTGLIYDPDSGEAYTPEEFANFEACYFSFIGIDEEDASKPKKDEDGNYLMSHSVFSHMVYDWITKKYDDENRAFTDFFGTNFYNYAMTIDPVLSPCLVQDINDLKNGGSWWGTADIYEGNIERARAAIDAGTPAQWQVDIIEAIDALLAGWEETCKKAATYRVFPVELLLGGGGDDFTVEDLIGLLTDPENATENDYLHLHAAIRSGNAARGFGAHPCPRGLDVKYNAVKKIFNNRIRNDMNGVRNTLTVHYILADGTEAKEDYVDRIKVGEEYNVITPKLDGYMPDRGAVVGTMGKKDVEVTVTYIDLAVGECVSMQKVSLSAGNHHLFINDKDMGEYTFAKSGSGWTIKGENGYLVVSSGKLTTSSRSTTTWTYSNNCFRCSVRGGFLNLFSTTYYLAAGSNGPVASTSNRNNTVTFYDGAVGTGEHQPLEEVKENVVAATCKAGGGYDLVRYCSVCGKQLSRKHVVEEKLTEHTPGTPVEENVVAATCTEDGRYDEVTNCTVCGEKLSTEHKVIEATGHTHGTPVHENEHDATCTDHGSYDEVTYCSVCGKELSRDAKEIAAKGHTPGKAKRETFGDVDYMVTRCTVCGEIIEQKEAPAEVITANVTVTSRTSGFWIFSTTTYTAKILAMSDDSGVTVSKVEYSTNNRSWRTGTSYQSSSKINTLYVRVTDSTGAVTNFVYKNGTVTKL